MGEAVHAWGTGDRGNTLYLPPNFVVSLKPLQNTILRKNPKCGPEALAPLPPAGAPHRPPRCAQSWGLFMGCKAEFHLQEGGPVFRHPQGMQSGTLTEHADGLDATDGL